MTPVTGRQTILTNYPIATREDKAVSKSYLDEYFFFLFDGLGVLCIF